MDTQKLATLLRQTLNPNERKAAEEQLKEFEKVSGLPPALLQIVMNEATDMSARHAGVLFLKNLIRSSWLERSPDEPAPRIQMQDKDRVYIREHLVLTVIHSPPLIRAQLLVCVYFICKHDFPSRWPDFVNKLAGYLQSADPRVWPGALMSLLELERAFNTWKKNERAPLNAAMNHLLPSVQQVMERLMMMPLNENELLMQRLVMKIFYIMTEDHLPPALLEKQNGEWMRFRGWMQVSGMILNRRNPDMEKVPNDETERSCLEKSQWWKSKKWSMRIMTSLFSQYGNPPKVKKKHREFAQQVQTYSKAMIDEVLRILLDSCHHNLFVAEKVLQEAIRFLRKAVEQSHSWELIKPDATNIFTHVIAPLMCKCHSAEADQLWKDDPLEFIRSKYGEGESSITAGEKLLSALCSKKEVLPGYIQLISQLLNDPVTAASPQRMDGALHIVGAVADILLKKNMLKEQFEDLLIRLVLQCIGGPFHFLRARSAWLISKLSLLRFHQDDVLPKIVNGLVNGVLKKEEHLPVKVQSAFAIEDLVIDQHRSHQYFQPYIRSLCLELLEMIRNTEDDGLASALRKILKAFPTDVAPLANDICLRIAKTFNHILESAEDDSEDDKSSMTIELLHTLERVLEVMEDQKGFSLHEGPILQLVTVILEKGMSDLYEKAFSLTASLTSKHITPPMWKVYEGLYKVIEREKDGTDHFVEMMPAFYNFITVDTEGFLQVPDRLIAICTAIKKVLIDDSGEVGEEAESHAAKLIEVMILQCRHRIQNVIPPLLQIVLERLGKPIETPELRTMCLQVIMASIYHDLNQTVGLLSAVHMEAFIKQWISDIKNFSGVHNRKICILGVCALLHSPNRPAALQQYSKEIMPSLLSLFDGLKKAYAETLRKSDSDNDSNFEEGYDDFSGLEDFDSSAEEEGGNDKQEDDGEADDEGMNGEVGSDKKDDDGDEDDDEEDDGEEEDDTPDLDRYTTPIDSHKCPHDEYVIFKEVLTKLDPGWYSALTSGLTEGQKKSVQEIFSVADTRKAIAGCQPRQVQ